MKANTRTSVSLLAAIFFTGTLGVRAALLAYEPFTNAVGTAIIGSGAGFGFAGAWQANSSGGTATNTGYGLAYTDAGGLTLVASGGAGFFQGLTTANTSMQPIRSFNFSRGTNGLDGVTTWISFLIARQGPTGTLAGNLYGRGANVPHDLGTIQKLATGNSSGAGSNTVGLIPTGAAANLKGSTNAFGGVTNFVVVRIDHTMGAANDNAYLFINPVLNVEPAASSAGANSTNGFDFSFNQLRVFAGGQSSAAQPYAEIVVDEYRIGESYSEVTPFTVSNPPPVVAFQITNAFLLPAGIALAGQGGSNSGSYLVLATTNLTVPLANWTPIATNAFDMNGNFNSTNPTAGSAQKYFRLLIGGVSSPTGVAPIVTIHPTNQTIIAGNSVTFNVAATGTAPLRYQWYFNANTPLATGTNAALTLFNVQSNNAGSYSVIVTNNFGAATSSVAALTVNPAPTLLPGAFFVSTTGSDANAGTEANPFLTISKGLNTIPNGGVVYLRGGTYAQSAKLSLTRTTASPTNTIRLWAYPGEVPVVDATGNSSDSISISGRNYHLRGLTVKFAGHNGINISGHSNLVENCIVRENGNTGLHITGGSSGSTFPSYNVILNCDAFLNYDPPVGGNADGFSAKWNLGPGNEFRGCRAWWNSDDGWDLWMGTSAVVIDQSWAFYNGTNYWNDPQFNGNGQGFKLGGNYIGAPHRLLRSVAFRNESGGVDQNNNNEGQTIDNNTSWANVGRNYNLNHGTNGTPHIVRNNLSFAGGSSDSFRSGSLLTNNSWQIISAPAANASDVLSTIESVATAPRNPDGSLPYWPFLRPVSGGRLIDQGVILTEPFIGASPDLGAFEDGL